MSLKLRQCERYSFENAKHRGCNIVSVLPAPHIMFVIQAFCVNVVAAEPKL